jgi:iron complex outermembrane receptor protein
MALKGIISVLRNAVACAALSTALLSGASVSAKTAQAETVSFNIPAGSLQSALTAFADQSGLQLIYAPEAVVGRRVAALRESLSPRAALQHLIANSGLRIRQVDAKVILLESALPSTGSNLGIIPAPSASAEPSVINEPVPVWSHRARRATVSDAAQDGAEIVVTGSRIRGAPTASTIISVDREDMHNAGQSNVGDVVRSIPQSFGGGQNPGVGFNVPSASGVDVGGGSSINLRGLGSDATLTLLNGRRMPYSSSRQSVDVSAIPFAAIERIEIVPDGASAIYGSDAVAGVANIILRRRYDGLETSASLGASTDGGNFTQQYGALAGRTWASGSAIAAYEFSRNTAIESKDRSYAATQSPGVTLFPKLKRHAASLSIQQRISDNLSIEVDGLYNKRWRSSLYPLDARADLSVSAGRSSSVAKSYVIAPTMTIEVRDWQIFVAASFGRDKVQYATTSYRNGIWTQPGGNYYQNTSKAVELGGDGTVLSLPGGDAKLAVGLGYRENEFVSFRGDGNWQNTSPTQDSYFAYAELNVPIISPSQALTLAHRINASFAVRYEKYPGIDEVLTPKIGLIYAPSRSIDIKGSWGKSFRAPTLLQQYQPSSIYYASPTSYGGAGFPAGATVLEVLGGNPALKPERADTLSFTLDIHPPRLPGFGAEITYFSTSYRDRIVQPIGILSIAMSDPMYRDQIILSPTEAMLAAEIANAGTFINGAGRPYDPASVVAIINNGNVNSANQKIQGVDVLLTYLHSLGAGGENVKATLNLAYLESEQRLTAIQPVRDLAGTLFNPPHLRARGGLTWTQGAFVLSSHVSHIGSVRDIRSTPNVRIKGMTTVDFAARYNTGDKIGPLSNLDITLSAQNLFNAKPANIRITGFTHTPYDSTNYSAIGRYISVGVTKTW